MVKEDKIFIGSMMAFVGLVIYCIVYTDGWLYLLACFGLGCNGALLMGFLHFNESKGLGDKKVLSFILFVASIYCLISSLYILNFT